MSKKIVIFDMDGTLIDSKKDIALSVNYVREKKHSLAPLSEEFIVDAINMDVRNLPKLFYETDEYQEADRVVFEAHYKKQCTQNVYLYDGVKETLQALLNAKVKLAVATNAPTKFANLMLESLGIKGIFEMVIGADAVSASKPNPEMLLKILSFYGYNREKDSAWMVGDNSKDMQSAKNAEIDGLFATWGFTPQTDYEYVVHKPQEILAIVL